MNYSPTELEAFVRQRAPQIAEGIQDAASRSRNEADLVAEVEDVLKRFEKNFDVTLNLERERTLINGRADAVYNRFVIEYEPPRSLSKDPNHRNNRHAVEQVKQYMGELERLERHRKERLAGVVLDGYFYIFVRFRDDHWHIDEPVPVTAQSTETFLRYLLSLSTELALSPENLVRDFGENSTVARLVVYTLYEVLGRTDNPKVRVLFQQWQRQFSEITGWEKESSRLDLARIAQNFGIKDKRVDPLRFFFAVHTYYATFIKLLAVQIAYYYMMPKIGSGLKQEASADTEHLRRYLDNMERGGLFKQLGINNFLEGDFFGWYLAVWDDALDAALRRIIGDLANYSLVTLDVDPEETRDLLKKLYQNLMPRDLRHALGEYYTPDWLAERLLNQLDYKGDPGKRLLDPACGSGTFLVLAIKRVRRYADDKMLPPAAVLGQVLANIVGFDLNPLAVISARTNYLLALGDLLQSRQGEVTIPVYLADSILTPSQGEGLFSYQSYSFNTAVGRFSVPRSLVNGRAIDQLADLLEQSVDSHCDRDAFRQRLLSTFPPLAEQGDGELDVALDLYSQLCRLDEQGINGIWARIIKNAFAPLFAGQFDYIAGNPPWVNWESLPDDYRQDTKPLWERYGLFPHGGMDTILGKGKKDISMLMTYVAMDFYLHPDGRLGFIITQSVFKTAGAGQGFRRFRLGEAGERLAVLFVDDMSEMKPFEGAANRTAIVILQKGRATKYPVSYTFWRKTSQGVALRDDDLFEEVSAKTVRRNFQARPIDEHDITSSWLSGKPRALTAVRKIVGPSDYQARAGACTWLNGVYWLELIAKRPDGLLVMSNLTEGAKREVENVQMALEPDLVYPLLRGRDVGRWRAAPQAYILMVQDPKKRQGYDEEWLAKTYPKTYAYLKHFEGPLRERSGYRRYFRDSDPFYSIFDVSDYTFAPYKVVWPNIGSKLTAAVVGRFDSKPIIPQHIVTLVALEDETEAHYFCATINSSPANFVVQSYSQRGGKSFGTPGILENVRILHFNSTDTIHQQLAALSRQAHTAVALGEPVAAIEAEIDRLAARLWGLTDDELKEIQESLAELE